MLPNNILEALRFFYETVKNKELLWILSGSTSLVLQGVDVIINEDIDILTDERGSIFLNELLTNLKVKEVEYNYTDQYKSYFGVFNYDNIKIEIMGNFQYRLQNGDWSLPNQKNKVYFIEYEGMKLPVLSLKQELIEYKNIGKSEKVSKILEVINNTKLGLKK